MHQKHLIELPKEDGQLSLQQTHATSAYQSVHLCSRMKASVFINTSLHKSYQRYLQQGTYIIHSHSLEASMKRANTSHDKTFNYKKTTMWNCCQCNHRNSHYTTTCQGRRSGGRRRRDPAPGPVSGVCGHRRCSRCPELVIDRFGVGNGVQRPL